MTNGIFLACNSLSAMSRGSDSPFSGTSTGAFILFAHKETQPPHARSATRQRRFIRGRGVARDLESTGTEDSSALVLGHVVAGDPNLVGLLLLARSSRELCKHQIQSHQRQRSCQPTVARDFGGRSVCQTGGKR